MNDEVTDLSEKLAREGEKTLAFFLQVAPDEWDTRVYEDGARWTVSELLIHVTETESDMPRLIRAILEGGEGVPAGFDLDAYNLNQVQKAERLSPNAWIALFKERRAATVRIVSGLSEMDLKKRGRHPFLGQTEVVEMIRLMYLHLQLHQRDIRRALASR